MKMLERFVKWLPAGQKACVALCLVLTIVSGSICAASAMSMFPQVKDMPVANVSRVQAAEPVSKTENSEDEIDESSCLHIFNSAWTGYECRLSDFSDEYDVGDEVKVTVTYSKKISSQISTNVDGTWTTFAGEGKTLEATLIPDDDYLNIQITDMKDYKTVGIVSVEIEITLKNAAKLARMRYTGTGDYELFSGSYEEAYETDDLWLSYCDDADWLTLVYDCSISGQEGWGILGWGGSLNGEWINGPGYGADKKNSMNEVSVNFTVKYLRRMMGISKNDELDHTSLGAWSGGRIKSLVLHRGSLMPRSDILFENGAENEEWVCKDLEQILDENGARYLCLKYTCGNEENYGWTVMGWGAGVNGEWVSGKNYKVSEYEPTRVHYACMTVEEFRQSMGLSWDVKVDSISLGVYNQGRIVKLWLSDTPVSDPGDDVEFEEEWESANEAIYKRVAYKAGTDYPQNRKLTKAWEQFVPEGEQEIISGLEKGSYVVVSYDSKAGETPSLYIQMKDGTQRHVQAVWKDGKKAVFSYDCIATAFPGFLIPQEMKSLAVSTKEKSMEIRTVTVVYDSEKLEEEPIAVLTKSWSGFATEISRYHSGYKPGDKVRVTVIFDKVAPGTVAFNINGKWKAGKYQDEEKTFSVTATPDNDYMSIQLGEMPRTKSYVVIRNIKVEIIGKTNYDEAVVEKGDKTALLSCSASEAAKAAGLTDTQIKAGAQLIVTTANANLTGAEKASAQAALEAYADAQEGFAVSNECVDISLALVTGTNRTAITSTGSPLTFKIGTPAGVDPEEYDFAVVRFHGGAADLLPDLDDEPATITFASDKFSKYVVVYGPRDGFKKLAGDTSIHTFRSAWSSYEIRLNDYIEGNAGFGTGDTVKIEVQFDRTASSEINTNVNGVWTKIGSAWKAKSITATAKPDGETVSLQITDMLNEKAVKIQSIKVTITESAPLPVFTEAGSQSITLSKYLKDFVAGSDKIKVIVNLSSDGAFKGNLEGNAIDKTGEGWKSANGGNDFESEDNRAVFAWITTPMYGEISLKISEMSGAKVEVTSITVERTDEEETIALPSFIKAGSKSLNLSNFLEDLVPGTDYVKVTVNLSSDGAFKGNLEGNTVEDGIAGWRSANNGNDYASDDANKSIFTWSMTPQYGEISLKITEMSGTEVKVESVVVERTVPSVKPVDPVDPETIIHTLTSDSDESKKWTFEPSAYAADYAEGDTVRVTVNMSSDGYFNGTLGTNVSGSWSGPESGFESDADYKATAEWTVKPDADSIQIEAWNTGKTGVKITGITVEVTEKGGQEEGLIHTFSPEKNAGGGYDSFGLKLADYCLEYQNEDKVEITVELSSDAGFNGILEGNIVDAEAADGYSWQKANSGNSFGSTEAEGKHTAAFTWTAQPKYDSVSVSIWWMAEGSTGVDIDSITVVKSEGGQEEGPIHTFSPEKNAGGGYDSFGLKLADYCLEYQNEDKVEITVELSSDAGFNGILEGNIVDAEAADGYSWQKANSGNSFGSTEEEGKQKAIFTWTVQPKYDSVSVSIWWMAEGSTGVDIDSITVEKVSADFGLSTASLSADPVESETASSSGEAIQPAEALPDRAFSEEGFEEPASEEAEEGLEGPVSEQQESDAMESSEESATGEASQEPDSAGEGESTGEEVSEESEEVPKETETSEEMAEESPVE